MKKTIALTLVAFSLVACKAPQIRPQIRVLWSSVFNQCYCQDYDLNEMNALNDFKACDFSYCDDLVGFQADAWAKDITPWGRAVIRYGEDSCKK